MFIVMLKFADKTKAAQLMGQHNDWIAQGFDDGVFVLVGSMKPNAGGAVIAHNATLAEIEARVAQDPFVAEGVVVPYIVEITPNRFDERLALFADSQS